MTTFSSLLSSFVTQDLYLPILHRNNSIQHNTWVLYLQNIYKENISHRVIDLNQFTWFYYSAPLHRWPVFRSQQTLQLWDDHGKRNNDVWQGDIALKYHQNHTSHTKKVLQLQEGDAFVGKFTHRLTNELIPRATHYGFFVHRKSFHYAHVQQQLLKMKRIEVLHVTEKTKTPTTWFWLVKGSGVFLDVSFARNIHIFHSRDELPLYKRVSTKGDIDYIDMHILHRYMREKHIDIIVFMKAHGIPEMIVHNNHVQNDKMFCLPKQWFYSGFNGQLRIRGQTAHPRFPLIHITQNGRPPAWFSAIEYAFYNCLLEQKEDMMLTRMQDFANKHGESKLHKMLRKWFPVWCYHPVLKRYIDILATPMLFAIVLHKTKLQRYLAKHLPIEAQLNIKHLHNPNVDVRDMLFTYATVHTKLSIRLPIQSVIYIRVPIVSQHFWHFMMGEFLPVVAEIIKHTATKVYIIKDRFVSSPLNAFYKELPVDVHFITRTEDVPPTCKVIAPLNWNYFNHHETHKLTRAVKYIRDWANDEPTTTPFKIVVQDRGSNAVLNKYYAKVYNKECGLTIHQPSSSKQLFYGAQRRRVTNLRAIASMIRKTHRNTIYHVDDGMTLKAQVKTYLNASMLVLGHGSGMVHLLWMKPNTTVIEIIPKHRLNEGDGYSDGCNRLCQLMGFDLKRVFVEESIGPVNETDVLEVFKHIKRPSSLISSSRATKGKSHRKVCTMKNKSHHQKMNGMTRKESRI